MFEKIMVVEDDNDFRLLLVDKLLKLHYEIIQAEDGEQAIAKLSTQHPKLIILDLLLPKMDGFEVLNRIHQVTTLVDTPVIVYTNLNKPGYLQKAQQYNIEDYYLKSQVEIDSVCDRVRELLEKNN